MDSSGKEEKKTIGRTRKKTRKAAGEKERQQAAGRKKVSDEEPFLGKDKPSKQKKTAGKKPVPGQDEKNEKTGHSGSPAVRNTESREGRIIVSSQKGKGKPRNPNLRLVKNGDLPVKGEGTGKKEVREKRKAEEKKTSEGKQEGRKKPEGNRKREEKRETEGKGKREEKQEAEKSRKRKEKREEGRTGKQEAGGNGEQKGKQKAEEQEKQEERSKTGELKGQGEKQEEKKKTEGKEKQEKGKKAREKGRQKERKRAEGKKKQKENTEKGEKGKPKEREGAGEQGEKTEGKKEAREEPKGKEQQKEDRKEKKRTEGKNRQKENRNRERKKKQRLKAGKRRDKDSYQDKLDAGEWFIQHKSLLIVGLMVFSFLVLIVGIYRYIITAYEVTTVYVDGNVHYTNEEIMEMVMEGRYGDNSLYLAMKYRNKGIEGVPFVEKMDVHILSPDTIRISVYEKALAGYVEYLGRYMYFDRDGTVVESSEKRTSGIPQVTGLKFDYVVLNELLPVENDEIFKRILDITQLLNKYELMADKIFFDSAYNLTLFFDDVRVTLGSDSDIDHKIIRLKSILPELEGKKGTLQMGNYTEDTKNITFHQE